MRPKLMIVGHAHHGKDTVGELLKELYGYQFDSSSHFAGERVVLPYINQNLGAVKTLTGAYQEMKQDQTGYLRQVWYTAICEYCDPDRARLAREIFAENDCYVGIRQVREFMCARNEGLFDFAIWVDRSYVLPAESTSSNVMQPWMCDFWLDNNGTLEDLRRNLVTLMDTKIMPKGQQIIDRLRAVVQPTQMRRLTPAERRVEGRPAKLEGPARCL